MFDTIIDAVEGFLDLETYITQAYDFLLELSYVEQLVGALIVIIVGFLGTFELIKKLSKLIIVVVILGGLWVLYNSGAFESLIG